jgi:dissimilatory sulfite reductase (desulfoviridin) alpha/beta subunit
MPQASAAVGFAHCEAATSALAATVRRRRQGFVAINAGAKARQLVLVSPLPASMKSSQSSCWSDAGCPHHQAIGVVGLAAFQTTSFMASPRR